MSPFMCYQLISCRLFLPMASYYKKTNREG